LTSFLNYDNVFHRRKKIMILNPNNPLEEIKSIPQTGLLDEDLNHEARIRILEMFVEKLKQRLEKYNNGAPHRI